MPSLHEVLSEQFYRWETRGRGYAVFETPVAPEPPFVPFRYCLPNHSVDDGVKPTVVSSLVQLIARTLGHQTDILPPADEELDPEPQPLERSELLELQFSLPRDFDPEPEVFGQFLQSVFPLDEPLAFEVLGTGKNLILQLALASSDHSRVRKQIGAFFPEVGVIGTQDTLQSTWNECQGGTAIVEFGLAREFILGLAENKVDPLIGIAAALTELGVGELGLFQVVFEPVRKPWSDHVMRAITTEEQKPVFVNRPELVKAAEKKLSESLFAVVLRIAGKAPELDRSWEIARDMASALRVFRNPAGNEFIPLQNDEYPPEAHEEDVPLRQSHRSGMILAVNELIGLTHLPSVEVPALARELSKTKPAPNTLQRGILLGHNTHAGKTIEVRLAPEQRVRHCHIIGASGTGKSTLLYNLISQDIANGSGIAVLDPHGDLIDRLCGSIPPERIEDVVLVDPSDPEYSVGFNILSAHSELEKTLLASDLVAIFERLSTSWGDQMNSVLQNAILAFLESDRRGTLADLRRFLVEPAFRTEFLTSVRDSEVVYYWHKSFPHLSGNKSIGSILTRLDTFLAQKPIRHMVSQQENRLDFAHIMDSGKIFLAKLPEGLLGRENSYLLGSLLVAKFQQIAMSRQAQQATLRRDFWLYIDEFANFISPSMAEILSGARKYRIGLTLAHHELRQLQRNSEVASAVLSHPFTRIVFRIGDDDARKLADGFSHFDAKDIGNLEIGRALCRVERSDFNFNLSIPLPLTPDETAARTRKEQVTTASRRKYGTLRSEVEALLSTSREAPKDPSPRTRPPVSITPILPSLPVSLPEPRVVTKQPETAEEGRPAITAIPLVPSASDAKKEPSRTLGKGGAQHTAIQNRIKEAAQSAGFLCSIETELPGQQSVDVALERDGQRIACEISITTTVDHEVQNVKKCIDAGFSKVAVICIEEGRLQKLEKAILRSLGSEIAGRVGFHLPDEFIASLKAQALPQTTTTTVRGYKVKRSMAALSPDERKQREDLAIRSIAETLKKK